MDVELAPRARSAGRRGRGRGAWRRRRGRRPARRCGSSSRAVGPSAGESTAPSRSASTRKPACAEQLAGVVLDLLEVLAALDEDVGDGEGVVERQRGVVAAGAHLLGPDLARDVEQHAAAVTLAVDVAGAVEHLLQRRRAPARSARGSASRPCGPRRRSRRRPCPRRSAAKRAAGRRARASSGRPRSP